MDQPIKAGGTMTSHSVSCTFGLLQFDIYSVEATAEAIDKTTIIPEDVPIWLPPYCDPLQPALLIAHSPVAH